MSKPRQPCPDCGGPKPPVRGAKYCEVCRDKRRPIWERESARRKNERQKAMRAEQGRTRRWHKDDPPGQRWCARCQQYLALSEFATSGKRLNSYCRECYSLFIHERRLLKEYGVSLDAYDRLLQQQDGRCAICLGRPRTMRLAVDHDHKTGEIRGLLCRRCNQNMIGTAHERVDLLLRAASYLRRPPAQTGAGLDDLGNYIEAELESLVEDAKAKSDHWAVVLYDEDKPIGEWPMIISHELFMAMKPSDCVVIEKDIEDLRGTS